MTPDTIASLIGIVAFVAVFVWLFAEGLKDVSADLKAQEATHRRVMRLERQARKLGRRQ